MIAELLATLAGHPSSLFSGSSTSLTLKARDDLPFLHPAEVEILNKLATYSTRYVRIRSYAKAELEAARKLAVRRAIRGNSLSSKEIEEQQAKTSHLVPLCSTLLHLLKGYHDLVLKTERDVLANDAELVAEKGFVSLSNIRARLEEWDAPLTALNELVAALLRGKDWTGGLLLDLLAHKATTGVQRVARCMQQLHDTVHQSWLVGLEAWVCRGQIADEPLVELSEQTEEEWVGTHSGSFVFLPNALPKSVTESTADSILYVGRAIHTSAPTAPPGEMTARHAALLRSDRPLERTINDIRHDISSWLFTTVLTIEAVQETLGVLASYLLHRDGVFSLTLRAQVEKTQQAKLSARSALAGQIRASDMDLALRRSLPGEVEALRFAVPKKAGLFDATLAPLPFQLLYDASFPMDLFFTHADLRVYTEMFSYIAALKRTQSRVLACWMNLSKSQRSRRKFTGTGEGGTDRHESDSRTYLLRRSWGLARNMLWFLDTLLGHFQTDVVDVAFARLAEAQDVMALRAAHTLFLSSIEEGTLLREELTTVIAEILSLCTRFAGQVERWGGDVLPSLLFHSPSEDRAIEIHTLTTDLTRKLERFFELLGNGKHTQLLLRLDFNDYLSSARKTPPAAA